MSYSKKTEDKVLWQAFKRGDETAFAELYKRYMGLLFSYGKKISGDEQAVEDGIQDLFIDLWQSRSRLGDVETARFYLFSSLRRKLIHTLRQDKLPADNLDHTEEWKLPVSPAHESALINAEIADFQTASLQDRLKQLPLRQYEVLMLYYYHGFSYTQISDMMSINEQSVRNLQHRGLQKLRQLITWAVVSLFLFNFL